MTEYQISDCQKVLEKFVEDTRSWGEGSSIPVPFVGWHRHCTKETAEEIERILHPLTWSQE